MSGQIIYIWSLNENERFRHMRRAQKVISYLDLTTSDLILDVGCGEGFVTSHFMKARFALGLDAEKESLLIAKQHAPCSNVDFVQADVAAMPLRKGLFDKAVILEVLEHLPIEQRRRVCNEVDNVLKEKAVLVISVPYNERIIYTRCIHCGKLTPLYGHLTSMDCEKVKNLLPNYYRLITSCCLPNAGLITLSRLFQILPTRLWFILNNLIGKYTKGYWLLTKYQKDYLFTL